MKDANQEKRAGDAVAGHAVEDLLQHQDWLGRLASRLVHGSSEAQDLVQETLLVGSSTTPPADVNLRAWLGGVARNLARARGRKGARRTEREANVARDDRVPSVLTEVTTIERQRDLLDALMELPETQRRVVMARYYEGWPPRRMASEFSLPLATVKSQLQRGLAGLRTRLDATYGDRKSWTVALLPLARSSGLRAGGLVAGKGFMAAAAGVLVLGGVGAWALSAPAAVQAVSGPMVAPPIEAVAMEDGPAHVGVELLEAVSSPASDHGPRTSPTEGAPKRGPQVVVRAVVAATGVEVPVLDGFSIEGMEMVEMYGAVGQPKPSFGDLAKYGDALVFDAEGVAKAEGEFPLVVHVVSGELRGYAVAGEDGVAREEVVVSLWRAEPLVIRVVDSQGEPLEAAVPVVFDALVPSGEFIPLGPDGILSAPGSMDWVSQEFDVPGGEQSLRFLFAAADPPHLVVPARAAQLRAFHVNVPGALEFFPELVKFGNEVRMPAPQGEAVVELVAPDLGAVEVHVTVDGLVAEVDGTATLRWLDAPVALPNRTFQVPLKGGRASWPRVVAGAHPFSVELHAKSHSRTWSVEAISPRSAGDLVRLETELSTDAAAPVARAAQTPAVLVSDDAPDNAPVVAPDPTVEMRRVEVRWPARFEPVSGKLRQALYCSVLNAEGQQVGGRRQQEALVPVEPMDPPWTLWISSMGCRPQPFVVSELGDVLEVVLKPGVTTSFKVSGESPLDSVGCFEHVPGGPKGHAPVLVGAAHGRAYLPRAIHDGDQIDLLFPQGGRYELVIYRTDRGGDGHAGREVTSRRTGKFVDVFDPLGDLPDGMTPGMARERNASLVLEY